MFLDGSIVCCSRPCCVTFLSGGSVSLIGGSVSSYAHSFVVAC
jgi:hypothetical protein